MKRTEEFERIQTAALFVAIAAVGVLMWKMFTPFFFALFWAAILAALFYPVYTRVQHSIPNKQLASLVTVLIALVLVLIPISLTIGLIVDQAIALITYIRTPEFVEHAQTWIAKAESVPYVNQVVSELHVIDRLKSASSTIAQWGVTQISTGTRSIVEIVISFFVMLYCFYYFLQDGYVWLQRFMSLLPLGDRNEKHLYKQFVSTARATLKGTILIGIIQGVCGGVLFWATGVPSAAFWALIMTIFAIIPAVGPVTVMVPVAIYFAVMGNWVGMGVIIAGIVFVSVIDNLLRPRLVGRDMQMHPVLILLATIGGISLFGISGVVIGPMIAAFFFSLVHIYEEKYKANLEEQG